MNTNERKICQCGRRYIAQEWKTDEEKSMCFSCYVRKTFNKKVLGDLSLREQKIIDMRFGLTDGLTHTLEETGKMFGVTRERIRQIEAKAIMKLEDYKKAER